MAHASGTEVDRIDLALSVVGLGASSAVLVSGGSSAVGKAGAVLARTARRLAFAAKALGPKAGRTGRDSGQSASHSRHLAGGGHRLSPLRARDIWAKPPDLPWFGGILFGKTAEENLKKW